MLRGNYFCKSCCLQCLRVVQLVIYLHHLYSISDQIMGTRFQQKISVDSEVENFDLLLYYRKDAQPPLNQRRSGGVTGFWGAMYS